MEKPIEAKESLHFNLFVLANQPEDAGFGFRIWKADAGNFFSLGIYSRNRKN